MHSEFSRWGLALVLLVGLLLRIGFLAYANSDISSGGQLKDPDDYGRLALNLVRTGTFGYPMSAEEIKLSKSKKSRSAQAADDASSKEERSGNSGPAMRPSAFRPPLYPALLIPAVIPDLVNKVPISKVSLNPFVVLGIHALLGMITIGLVYYIAWRMDYRLGWIPAFAVAMDPVLLHWSSQMMTETLITFLAVWAWALYLMLVRPNMSEVGRRIMGMRMSLRVSMVLGLVLGMAVLTRPTMLPWAVLLIASLGFRGNDAGNRVSMITAALIVMSVINAAWMFRNKQALGKPIWTTTHGGYTLLLANNPKLYDHFEKNGPSRDWKAQEFHDLWAMRREGDPTTLEFWNAEVSAEGVPEPNIEELRDDNLAQQAAVATIIDRKEMFVLSCIYRAGWLWSLYPYLGKEPTEPELSIVEAKPTADSESTSKGADSKTDVDSQATSEFFALEADMKDIRGNDPSAADAAITAPASNEDKPIEEKTAAAEIAPSNANTEQNTEPNSKLSLQQIVIGSWYAVWFVMAAIGLLWLREALTSRVWLLPVLLVLTLTAIHAIYWSNMRMRAPMMPVVYMLACWPLMRTRTPPRL